MMRKRIAASTYTRTGDPMRLDCGYRALISGSNGTSEHSGTSTTSGLIRIFQAVSLEGDVDGAKGLAWAAPQLREGVRRVESAELELTAVVEPVREVTDDNEAADRYRFGVEAMEREAIRVVTLNDLARVAETARMELGI
jgi:uncharacterized protein (UPF0335 family)